MPKRPPDIAPKKAVSNFKSPAGTPNFIRKWRKHRGYTQEQMSEMTGMSTATISLIETQKQDFTGQQLLAFAEALQCDPQDLTMRDPSSPEAIWSLWDRAEPGQRKAIIRIIDGYLKAGGE